MDPFAVRSLVREFALGFPGAYEEFPWGESVAKVNKGGPITDTSERDRLLISTASRQAQRGALHDTLRGADRDDGQQPGGSQHPLVQSQRQQYATTGIHGQPSGQEQLKAFLRKAVNEVLA